MATYEVLKVSRVDWVTVGMGLYNLIELYEIVVRVVLLTLNFVALLRSQCPVLHT